MKKNFLLLLTLSMVTIFTKTFSQNIAINETGNLPDTSAMLDVSSTSKGFLTPRMTTVQQNAIPLPAKGLLLFNTNTGTFNVNTGTPASPVWTILSYGGGSTTNTLSSTTNTITSTVNGVNAAAPLINTNLLSLSSSNLTSTINGIASSALDLSSAIILKSWSLTGNSGTTAGINFIGTTDAIDFVTKTNNTERMRISSAGYVGIGTLSPTNTLHVAAASNPLLLSGVQSGAATDSVLSINTSNGIVRYLNINRFSGGSGWGLTGNNGTNSANFIGTNDGQPLTFKVNGTKAGYLGLSGSSYATAFGISANAGFKSTAIGAGADASAANEATAFGYNAAASGYRSIAFGSGATASSGNNETIAIGYNSSVTAFQGIAIGSGATVSTNNSSLAIGAGASARGYLSVAIGSGASATAQNSTAIGNGASATNANYISIGNTSVAAIRGQVNFTTYSDGRFKRNIKANVPGLDFILKLRPVTYNWNIHQFNAHSRGAQDQIIQASYNSSEEEEAIRKKESITYTGFIAQEVDLAAQSSNFNFSGVLKPVDDKDAYSLSYAEFVVPLVKATQELNNKISEQQKVIELLQKEIKELKKKIH